VAIRKDPKSPAPGGDKGINEDRKDECPRENSSQNKPKEPFRWKRRGVVSQEKMNAQNLHRIHLVEAKDPRGAKRAAKTGR